MGRLSHFVTVQQRLYSLTIFLGALLLFLIQPLFARLLLPLMGGAPGVWNTAMVFYQAALLLGYLYAHLSSRYLQPKQQTILHGLLLIAGVAFLPVGLRAGMEPPSGASPVGWLLMAMLTTVGLPFFLLSATSPLLQRWFSRTGQKRAPDPYFLYVASNWGSMIALLSYPIFVEPYFTLKQQRWAWSGLYVLLAGLLIYVMVRSTSSVAESAEKEPLVEPVAPIAVMRWIRWILLAFVPSSMLIAVTTHITTDIASFPLLWVIPLAIYLLSFILVFSRRPLIPRMWVAWAFPFLGTMAVLAFLINASGPPAYLIPLDLGLLFVMALLFHGELARDRPAPGQLTFFYLMLSVGGALGGLFCAIIAPMVFINVLEYPITIIIGALLLPHLPTSRTPLNRVMDLAIPVAAGLFSAEIMMYIDSMQLASSWLTRFGLFLLLLPIAALWKRPVRFGLALTAVIIGGMLTSDQYHYTLHLERSFFGTLRVTRGGKGAKTFQFWHGTTVHGSQSFIERLRYLPIGYYYPTGPIGRLFNSGRFREDAKIAIIGLGIGGLSAYSKPGQDWTYYEIDPAVVRLASTSPYFTYIRDANAEPKFVIGDARLMLNKSHEKYDLIVLDAYNSDAVPVHLLTKEAMNIYFDHLTSTGVIAFHISNRHLNLTPVVAALAKYEGMVALWCPDSNISEQEAMSGKVPSNWVFVVNDLSDLAGLQRDPKWFPIQPDDDKHLWTDDYSSIISVFEW